MDEKKRKKHSSVKLILVVVFLLLIAVTAVVLIKGSDTLSTTGIMRYAEALVSGRSEAEEIIAGYHKDSVYASISDGIAAVTGGDITVYDKYGDIVLSEKYPCTTPAISSNEDTAAAYGIGGKSVRIFTLDGAIRTLSTANSIIKASINSDGFLAVCTEETGYKGSVTVYDSNGNAVYKWYSADGYVTAAEVSQDNTMLSVATMSQAGSSVIWFNLSDSAEKARMPLQDEVILDMRAQSGGLTFCVTSAGVIGASPDGTSRFTYSVPGKKLTAYTMGMNGKMALIYADYQTGGAVAIKTIDENGQEIGTYSTTQKVENVSICEDFVSVVYSGKIIVYNTNLEEVSTYESEEQIQKTIFRRDGAVLAVSAEKIRIYK